MSRRERNENSSEDLIVTEEEPLLKENPKRYVLFPIQYDDIWQMYKKAEASMWTVSDIDLSEDYRDWERLNKDEKFFISNVLAFFAASDGIVLENLAARFMNDVQIPEVRCFYGMQIAVENIHSETYSLLIDTYIKDEAEKNRLFNAIESIPIIKKKADWAKKYISSSSSFAERLIAFACVEGIMFSGSFCAIYWFKKQGKLPGLCFSNEYIARDEGQHTDFASLLYSKYIKNKLPPVKVCQIIGQAVAIEKEFVKDSLPVNLIGMNSELMCQYVEFVANRLCESLGLNSMYKIWKEEQMLPFDDSLVFRTDDDGKNYKLVDHGPVKNPFDFMEMISLQGKTNFFERKVGDYQKAGVMNSDNHRHFSTEEDF